MYSKRSKPVTGALSLVVAAAVFLAVASEPSTEDAASAVGGESVATSPSDNVTRSITIHAPSVAVRANPLGKRATATTSVESPQAGQWAFVDANGNLLSGPPSGVTLPDIAPRSAGDPASFASPVDAGATLVDTRHIRAVMSARLDAEGNIELQCEQHTDSPDHQCEIQSEMSNESERVSGAVEPTEEVQ